MAQDIDWEKGAFSNPKGSEPDWESGEFAEPKKPTRSLADWGKDIATTALKGAIGVPEALVGLADIPTGGAVGKFLENEGGSFGFRPKQAKEFLSEQQSDATKAARQEFQQAEGIGGKAIAALSNPSVIATTVGESLPSMFAGGALAKGIGLAAPALAGRAGLTAAGEGLIGAGSLAESVRQQTPDGLLTPTQSALAAGAGVATAGLSALGARAGKALGVGDIDSMIANGATQGVAREGMGLASRVGRGALSEGVLEELPQSLSETAFENVALGKPVTEGMDEAAVLGTLSGGLMGGVAGGLSRPAKPSQQMGIDPNAGPLSRAAASAVDSQPVPPAGGMGFNPDAGATTVFPDGSQSMNSEMPAASTVGGSITGTAPESLMGRASDPLAAQIMERRQQEAVDATPAQQSEPVPLEQRSLDELRQAFRSAQDPAIRKTLAAEIRKRREAMPDPLAQPQQEISLEPQAVKPVETSTEKPEAPAAEQTPVELGQPLTDTGTNMLGRGADPLLSIIQGQADARRAADELRGATGASTVTGGDITPSGVESPVADVRSAGRNDDAGTAQPDANGDAGRAVGGAAEVSAALRPEGWRTTAIKAGKVARSLGLDPKGKRLKEIVAEIDAVDAGSGVAAKPASREQAIRDAWRKEPRTIGKWTPISVEAEGQKADMLVNQKRAGGDKDGALHVVNIRMGKMLKDMEREPIAYTFRLTSDNRLVEEGIPTVATPGQIAAWKGAGFALDDKQANVQNAPQGTAGEAKAPSVKESKAEGGNAAANAGVPAAPRAGDVQADGVKPEPFVHSGLKIGVRNIKMGEVVEQKWVVQSPENAEREARGERQTGGDSIHDTRELAIKAAEDAAARHTARKEQLAELDAKEKASRDAEEARKAANRGKSIGERKADATLDKQIRESSTGDVITRREWVERRVKDGLTTSVTKENKIKPMSRMQAFRADNRQQAEHDRKVKEAGKKDVYWLGDFEVTKTEYDYANRVAESKKEDQAPQTQLSSSEAPQADGVKEEAKKRFSLEAGKPAYLDRAQKLVRDHLDGKIDQEETIRGFLDLGMTVGQVRSVATPLDWWTVNVQNEYEQRASQPKQEAKKDAAPAAQAEKPAEDDAFMGVKKDEPRNLVAMHNLTADNLLYADSIGGIPVPSIGITKIDSPFNGFGDVTLIAPSSMVDPEQGTPVFDRDAWTARFPEMNFKKVKAKVADAFYERMKPADGMGNDGGQFLSMLWEETRNASVQKPDKVADLFRRYNAPKMLYAKEVLGKEIKVPMRQAQLSNDFVSDKQLLSYWKKNGDGLIKMQRSMSGPDFYGSDAMRSFSEEVKSAINRAWSDSERNERSLENLRDMYMKEMFGSDGLLYPSDFNRMVRDFDLVGTKEIDRLKLDESVKKVVPDNDPAYQRWVKSLVEPLFEAPTITVRGKEVAPTLENIVDAMTIGATAGAEKSLTFGPGKTAAMLGKRFKSMAEIKADRDRVVSQDQENEGKKATEAILDQYRAKATAFFKGTDWRGNIDTWAANDASMEALAKAGKAGGSNADIRQALVRAGFKSVDQSTVDLASESIKALRNAATDYFEAKPQRAVKLSEFRAAVVPKGVSQEVKDVLTKNGIEVVEYNKKTEGARDAAIQKTAKRVDKAAKDILFMGDKAKTQRQGTPVDRAIMDMAGEGREANEILSFIAKSSKSPYRRQLAQKLLATGANPAVSLGGEMGGGAGFRFLAKYSRKNHEVTLSEAAADRAEQIFLHETVHAATLLALDKGGLIATQMKRLAANVYKDASPEMRKMYGLVLDKRTGEVNVGEFVAEAFTNPQFQKALKGMKADNGSLWDRLVNIVRRILGMDPRQQDALSKALELGAGVMRENMPLRAAKSFRAEDGPAFAGIDQTETPEFKRWFAGSKVVDANGKPLVVYHGTGSAIEKFRPTDGGSLGEGIYFTEDPDAASRFAERKGGQMNVMPVYISASIVLDADNITEEQRKAIDAAIPKNADELVSLGFPKAIAEDSREFIERDLKKILIAKRFDPKSLSLAVQGGPSSVIEAIYKKAGFDAITRMSEGLIGRPAFREYLVFRPEQIKSAIGNNGNFDPDDADIAHFGIADAVEQIKAFDVKEAPKNTWAHYRGMALQALGRRQLVDLYGDEFGTHLHEYDTLVQQMDAEKNETGAEADDIAQRWGKLKDEKALAELMHDATLAKMDPDKPMPAGYSKAEYDKLKTRFNTLSPEAKTLYREARDMYVAHYKAVQQAIKDRIERSEMSPSEKKRMMASLDDKLFKELQGVYFPLARFGQYVIVVKDANGEVKNVTRAETVKEAEQARKELQKAFPAHMGNTVGKVLKQAEFNAGRDAVGKGFMADLMNALDEKGVDDELRDTVAQLYLSSLPDLSWAKHGIHRKGTPGFSQDARRAFAQNAFHGARYLAKLRYSDRLQDELTGMQEYVKAFEGVDEYDSIQGQQVVDEMVKRHEILMNPKSSQVSTALTSFGFLFHMGLSPASAMVNLTQTALVAYPQMGAKWGFGKAGAALTKASEEVVRAKNDLSKALKGDELAAFDRAVKDGTIDVTMAHDLSGIAQGEDQGVMWKVRPVMRWASFMFHHAEKFNRQATFLAAFRLSKESNPEKPLDWHYKEAKKATYDGHYDYSAANRARIMQGNWQRVILLFKAFAQNTIYTLARNAYLSVKALDPKERSQARKTLAGLMASHAAAAGVLGLPIVGPLLTVASWIGGDDDEPWDAEIAMQNAMAEMIGPKAAEVVARGFSRLTPFDLSGRVALNKLILPDVQEGLEGKEWAESAMAAALGPVAGIGVNMARGAQKITEGDYLRGMEDMMPTALRGPLKALRYANEGAVDKTGIVITDEVGAAGVLGQASGFSPSQVRRDTERRSAIYAYDRALLERRSVLMRMMAEARIQGDTETAAEVQKDIQRFNEKNPTRRITPMNIAQSVRNRRKRIDEADQGVYLPSKRRDALDAVSF